MMIVVATSSLRYVPTSYPLNLVSPDHCFEVLDLVDCLCDFLDASVDPTELTQANGLLVSA